MAASSWTSVPGDLSLVLSDGTGTPVTFTATTEMLSGVSISSKALRENVIVKARGNRIGQRDGAQVEEEITVEFVFREFTNASAGTLLDFVHFRGSFSANVSTGGAGYEREAVKAVFTIDRTTASKFHTGADNADMTATYAALIPISEAVSFSDDNTEARVSITFQNVGADVVVTGQT